MRHGWNLTLCYVKEAKHKNSTYMKPPHQANPQNQKAVVDPAGTGVKAK
jgi:hypothetical protein